jgi:hypothetical protein
MTTFLRTPIANTWNLPRSSHRCSLRTCIRTRLTIRSYDGLQIIALPSFLLTVAAGCLGSARCNLFSLIDGSLFEIGTVHDSASVVGGSFNGARRPRRDPAVNALTCRISWRDWRRRAWMPSCLFRSAVTVSSKGLNTSQRRERRTPGSFKGETGGVDRERARKIPKSAATPMGASNKR